MAKAIWSGHIQTGMISVPVKLYTATEEKDVAFTNIHTGCGTQRKMKSWCPTHDTEVFKENLQRAYAWSKTEFVVIEDADLDGLPVATKYTISLDNFVEPQEIDRVYCDKTYWLEPEEAGARPYRLIMGTLERKGLVAVAKIALRNKERVCLLRPYNGVMVLETMFWPDEVRNMTSGAVLPDILISDLEAATADMLIDMLREPFDIHTYRDEYRLALLAMIEAKKNNTPTPTPVAEITLKPPTDLMTAMKIMMEQIKKQKGKIA